MEKKSNFTFEDAIAFVGEIDWIEMGLVPNELNNQEKKYYLIIIMKQLKY